MVPTNLPTRAWSSVLLSLTPVHGVGDLNQSGWFLRVGEFLSSVLKLCDDARTLFLTEGSS